MLVDNSHTLYITNHSIVFLIIAHTVTYHSNLHSRYISCLCPLFHITLRYIIVYFLVFTSYTISFYYSYSSILSFKSLTSPLHLPLSSPYKVHSDNTYASLFLIVHTCIYYHYTFMSSFNSLSLANILPSPSITPAPHFHLKKRSILLHIYSFICTYPFSLFV